MYPREIEASVQMRLYTLSKRQFVLVFMVFFIAFGLILVIGAFGPPIMSDHSINGSNLQVQSSSGLQLGKFSMQSPLMTIFNQQMWLTATVNLQATGLPKAKLTVPVYIGVKIVGVSDRNRTHIVFDGLDSNRVREMRCQGTVCEDMIIFHLGYLSYVYYHIDVIFYRKDEGSGNFTNGLITQTSKMSIKASEVVFHYKTFNPSYTQLELWFRFIFLTFTFIATCLYAHSLRQHSIRDWSMEQKWMSVLLPLLLLYNDPILPLIFLINSWIPSTFDALFQMTFLAGMLLFWLCIYHGVRVAERHFWSFYFPKLCVVGLIWLFGFTLSAWQIYNEVHDPTYNYRLDTTAFLTFKILFFIIGTVYVLYFLFLLVRAYAELRNMAYFNVRLKFHTALMTIVIMISLVITVLRFGAGLLQDNFIAGLSTHYQNSIEFLAFYGLLNLYTYAMAFVYSPSRLAAYESNFKDNPTVSMLNDSDEEVLYGSDYEETHLNSKR